MTKGSGDSRTQPLYFLITTAGTDTNSICYETHQKAKDIIEGRNVNEDNLEDRVCYGGLDLSSTTDIMDFRLVFLPMDGDDIFIRTDSAGNIKADKEKSTEKIDGDNPV